MARIPIILGFPATMWMGGVTFTLLLSTALIGLTIHKGWKDIPIKYHMYFALATIVSALIHISLVVYLYYF
jgi:hypothetical protein